MQYALVSSTCKTTRRNMTLAVERDVKTTNRLKIIWLRVTLLWQSGGTTVTVVIGVYHM